MTEDVELHFFNGIDGLMETPLLPPCTSEQLADLALGQEMRKTDLASAKLIVNRTGEVRGVGGDPCDLSQTGWGLVIPQGHEEYWRSVLSPLIEHRKQQVGSPKYYQELVYHPGQTLNDFLCYYHVGPGAAMHGIMPYYLLLAGSPEQIPYEFQFELDREYAVGRLFFEEDIPETAAIKYLRYAQSIVDAECAHARKSLRIALFGVDQDIATQRSAALLVRPLCGEIKEAWRDWKVDEYLANSATKQNLLDILTDVPALVFTASHGNFIVNADEAQRAECGALICQKPECSSGTNDYHFVAKDVLSHLDLMGSIFFHFACFSLGTPRKDEVFSAIRQVPTAVTPFVAHLPQRLLERGRLAVLGHVGYASSFTFEWPGAHHQEKTYAGILNLLRQGYPIGWAMELMNELFATLALDYYREKDAIQRGKTIQTNRLAYLWTGHIDARNFAILGDPAVRLNLLSS